MKLCSFGEDNVSAKHFLMVQLTDIAPSASVPKLSVEQFQYLITKHLLEPMLLLEEIVRGDCVRHELAFKRERWRKRDLFCSLGRNPAVLHNTRCRHRSGDVVELEEVSSSGLLEISDASRLALHAPSRRAVSRM